MAADTTFLSPNFNDRDARVDLNYVILHYTGMATGDDALKRLCDPASQVSAHYVIEEGGRQFQLVDDQKRAWHAGKSFWQGVTDLNSASIGIELVHPGHAFGYRGFASAQIESLIKLLGEITVRHKLSPRRMLLAHSDVAPGRKEDPGELFPWQKLFEAGFGFCLSPDALDYHPATDGEVQMWLRQIGYDCPQHGEYDRPTREAILAFQRHYEPNNLTGTPERETIARLRCFVRTLGTTDVAA